MDRLLIVLSFFLNANAGVVRVPKIYNALISSDANLTPSQAYPLLEPVYRTTALGVAFPPIVVHPALVPSPTTRNEEKNDKKEEATTETIESSEEIKQEQPPEKNKFSELAYHGTLYPLAFDPYFPYTYTSDFLFPALPYYQQPVFADFAEVNAPARKVAKEEPKPVPTNHKKSDIPDVPPPPLPIKDGKKK